MPVPSDPFALPITLNSDPVRGPIFIELDTDCLLDDTSLNNIFEKFPETSWDQRLFLFRESIAHKFGFINSATDRSQQPSSAMFSTDHQYIHCTGNIFLLIPTQLQLQTGIQGIKSRQSNAGIYIFKKLMVNCLLSYVHLKLFIRNDFETRYLFS